MAFLQDVFSSLLDQRRIFKSEKDKRNISELCASLMSEQGEVSGTKVASAVLAKYEALEVEEKAQFFSELASLYDLDVEDVIDAAQSYAGSKSRAALERLTQVSEPKRQELFRRLNQVPGSTEKLVHMREDLFPMLKAHPEYAVIDSDFEHLFDTWFNRGFLLLQPIDWRTPANILEKIIEYEAVHAINDWDDLRRRLQPTDRRCFGFFHPVMPEEPLIFVEVALTKGVPSSIESLLTDQREELSDGDADTAVFYSISNCQNGLRGVSFGNFLIKQVAGDLSASLPNIKNFVTLSPVPGFSRWLAKQQLSDENADLVRVLNADVISIEMIQPHQKSLMRLMAQYMTQAKRNDGFPVDPVSRFHLGNGASLAQINWMADLSENGLKQSLGMMVNYRYALPSVESNHESYVKEQQVHAAKEVLVLAK